MRDAPATLEDKLALLPPERRATVEARAAELLVEERARRREVAPGGTRSRTSRSR